MSLTPHADSLPQRGAPAEGANLFAPAPAASPADPADAPAPSPGDAGWNLLAEPAAPRRFAGPAAAASAAASARVAEAARAAGLPALAGLSTEAVMLLALQRSGAVPGQAVKAWADGDDAPLRRLAETQGPRIVAAAAAATRADAEAIAPHLDCARGGRLVDIGCGHGLVAAWLARLLRPAEIVLLDIEDSAYRGHFWGETGAGYAQLALAARMVEAEGVRAIPLNPARDPLPEGGFDAAISVVSCGFHYPVDDYAAFLAEGIRPGGAVSLDLRKRRAEAALSRLAALTRIAPAVEIGRTRKLRRMLFRRETEPT